MDEQLNPLDEQESPKPEAEVVSYHGDSLIVPKNWSEVGIEEFIYLGLEKDPEARKVLWNDIVSSFTINKSGQIQIEW